MSANDVSEDVQCKTYTRQVEDLKIMTQNLHLQPWSFKKNVCVYTLIFYYLKLNQMLDYVVLVPNTKKSFAVLNNTSQNHICVTVTAVFHFKTGSNSMIFVRISLINTLGHIWCESSDDTSSQKKNL